MVRATLPRESSAIALLSVTSFPSLSLMVLPYQEPIPASRIMAISATMENQARLPWP